MTEIFQKPSYYNEDLIWIKGLKNNKFFLEMIS